jgi:GH25 family lysozyme M1 (1,4-beta-N-acetylmuramidase)
VDFEKLKNAGVEFVMIRVGGTLGTNKEFFVDSKFVRNITEANKYNIPVGIYYFSYSMTKENAIKEANWVLTQIKDYKIDLPVVFDWEDWADYNTYNLSFYHLTEMANAFLDTVKEAGYEGMLYSSRNYLQKIWMETPYPIWLAVYNEKTNYDGKYTMWQLCDTGRVDGIDGPVDIDVMYID